MKTSKNAVLYMPGQVVGDVSLQKETLCTKSHKIPIPDNTFCTIALYLHFINHTLKEKNQKDCEI